MGIHRLTKLITARNWGETTTFPLIVFSICGHRVCTQMSFHLRILKLGVPKFSKLEFLQLWRPITFCVDLRLKWGLNQSYSLHRELSKGMWHTTCMQVNQGNSHFLVVGNQIGNLTYSLSFDHNMCFKYWNGKCKPNLNIYVSRTFQWYKELFNLMSFNPCNCSLKIWESIGTLTPKMGTHLEVCGFTPSHLPILPRTWNVILGLHSWPTPLEVFALIMSPRLGS
jgi:hypothetical protein